MYDIDQENIKRAEIKKKEREIKRFFRLNLNRCSKCNEVKPIDGFVKDKRSERGISNVCKDCYNAKIRSKSIKRKHKAKIYTDQEKQDNMIKAYERYFYHLTLQENPLVDFTYQDYMEIIADQDNKCFYCQDNSNLEKDHIIPIRYGGNHHKGNIQLLCRSCNNKKKSKINTQVLIHIFMIHLVMYFDLKLINTLSKIKSKPFLR